MKSGAGGGARMSSLLSQKGNKSSANSFPLWTDK